MCKTGARSGQESSVFCYWRESSDHVALVIGGWFARRDFNAIHRLFLIQALPFWLTFDHELVAVFKKMEMMGPQSRSIERRRALPDHGPTGFHQSGRAGAAASHAGYHTRPARWDLHPMAGAWQSYLATRGRFANLCKREIVSCHAIRESFSCSQHTERTFQGST